MTEVEANSEKMKKKKVPQKPLFWAPECKYGVIMDVAKEHNWKMIDDERMVGKVNLFWIDVATIHEHFRTIQPWQCINHFPGMPNIARKNRMGQNLNKMQKLFPKEYAYYPRTWVLPGELADFRTNFDNNGVALNNKIFIIKPDAGCQGRGIFLTRTLDSVPVSENVVAQMYIKKPLLLDGFKFDLRIYVIVTSIKPLRMYLFHDGLVRMCTEEYVKPTKHNLGQSCMHLTNYAVNKHNDNFQQPSACTSDGNQDDASKRSLLWFMNWVRRERGDAKANWLWKRIGVLCTRTLLAIMPTLSREYDQHFKSFNNIPVDMSKIFASAVNGTGSVAKPPSSTNTSRGRPGRNHTASSTNSHESEDDNDGSGDNESNHEDDHTASEPVQGSAETKKEEGDNSEGDGLPKIRGSRCFEVLGFDIMLDHSLNPWLIEVNHLPSFGTDSPLDRDIKDRLMRQVFSVLPTKGDDYAAYMAHQKVESEKRLISQTKERQAKLAAQQQAQQKPAPRPVPRPRREAPVVMSEDTSKDAHQGNEEDKSNGSQQQSTDDNNGSNTLQGDGLDTIDEECTPERIEEIKKVLVDIYEKFSPEKINKVDRLLSKYAGHEEEFLQFVFAKYNVLPTQYESEVKRQQRLQKQQEEFLLRQQQLKAAKEAELAEAKQQAQQQAEAAAAKEASSSNTDTTPLVGKAQDTSSLPRAEGATSEGNVNNASASGHSKAREPNKRYSRSLSPPRSTNNSSSASISSSASSSNASSRRASAVWKMTAPDEEALYREEVLALHVPDEDEEWLRFEMSRLHECTRIFPLVASRRSSTSSASASTAGNGGKEEVDADDGKEMLEEQPDENDDADDENNNKGNSKEASSTDASKKETADVKKSATYEEILFAAFLQDRRQTMRLRCPLPNRAIADPNNKDGFLPPLDAPSSSRSSFSTMGTGKGVVGWKAPPKPNKPDTQVVKQPTQQQLEFAKRLSQGLSTSLKAGNHTHKNKRGGAPNVLTTAENVQYSVILDPQEYALMAGANGNSAASLGAMMVLQQQQQHQQQMAYSNGQEILWPSTKAHRLYEESRNNRMRIEAARANNGAILRQQVFYFDPNYESYQPALVMGANPVGAGLEQGSVNGLSQVSLGVIPNVVAGNGNGGPHERRLSNSDGSVSSLSQQTYVNANNGGAGGSGPQGMMNPALLLQHQQQQQQQMQQQMQLQQQQMQMQMNGAFNNNNSNKVGGRGMLGGRGGAGGGAGGGSGMSSGSMMNNGQTIINTSSSSTPRANGVNGSNNSNSSIGSSQQTKQLYGPAGGMGGKMTYTNTLNASAMPGQQQQQATKQEELLRQLFPSWF